jgi:hypothetical protein
MSETRSLHVFETKDEHNQNKMSLTDCLPPHAHLTDSGGESKACRCCSQVVGGTGRTQDHQHFAITPQRGLNHRRRNKTIRLSALMVILLHSNDDNITDFQQTCERRISVWNMSSLVLQCLEHISKGRQRFVHEARLDHTTFSHLYATSQARCNAGLRQTAQRYLSTIAGTKALTVRCSHTPLCPTHSLPARSTSWRRDFVDNCDVTNDLQSRSMLTIKCERLDYNAMRKRYVRLFN